MAVTAAMVKELRQATGVGMMDCKNALQENDGDMEAAIDWLRKKGLSKAAKKSSRVAAEGLVAVVVDGNNAAIVEVNSETDFVARNDQFQALVKNISDIALSSDGTVAAIAAAKYGDEGKTVADTIVTAIATIGENISLRRADKLSVDNGVIASYVHNSVAPNLGKIGVLVALETTGDKEAVAAGGKMIAMHIAATNPMALGPDDLDPAVVERERTVLIDQAKASGKPDNVVEKMVEGRIRKYFEEVTLIKQSFVIDTDYTVESFVEKLAKDVGTDVKLAGFRMFKLGEGVEKKETDFAAEVAAVAGGN
ncbi:MAG: elongation factor Ts [Rhizobiales bacterium]|nr:elongation factor Ts [Hyphomicrobiales bacterium]